MKTLAEFLFHGKAVLKYCIEKTDYKTIAQAVASLTAFTHPLTVNAINNSNLFQITRSLKERGKIITLENGSQVMSCDNTGPTHAFLWSNGFVGKPGPDITFAHIWSKPHDIKSYTSLANICMIPAFLEKLTDTDVDIKDLLQYRANMLYNGYVPDGEVFPKKPEIYDSILWADPLPAIDNIEQQLRNRLRRKPRSRTTISAVEIGWYFSNYEPDATLNNQ